MRSGLLWLVGVVVSAGACNALLGIEERSARDGGGGAAAAGGGQGASSSSGGNGASAGGTGGGGAGVAGGGGAPPASCFDGVANGGESDTDCGGPCPACAPGSICTQGDDCTTGWCNTNLCEAAASCADLLDQAAVTSGVYQVDPDGGGPIGVLDVYCDMAFNGGGWTLAMKIVTGAVFGFDSAYWETTAVLNEGDLDPNVDVGQASNAKLEAFNYVRGNTLRLEWRNPIDDFVYDVLASNTLRELFAGGEQVLAGDETEGCVGDLLSSAPGYDAAHMRHGGGSQIVGISATQAQSAKMRFGFGSTSYAVLQWYPHQAIGTHLGNIVWESAGECATAICGCYGTAFEPATTAANLWVR